MAADSSPSRSWRSIPRGIWVLGFVSLLMDTSSEAIHALLPVYLVSILGMSALTVGVIEGIAEATASVTKVFSGALSDWLGRRKLLAAAGYGLAALTKPVFALATTVGWFVAARFVDRVGKGIRGSPRDALVADLSPPELRGASFGLRQALDTVGAFLGPLIAILIMAITADNFRVVFWVAVIPAFLSFGLIAFAVRDPKPPQKEAKVRVSLGRAELAKLGSAYWWVTAIAGVFTLARFSEAFLILKAQAVAVPVEFIPGVFVLMNIAYAGAAYPAGALSDRLNRVSMLFVGLAFLLAADAVLAFTGGIFGTAIGIVLWGLHMAFTQGLFAALVADTAPRELRGTAFGMFNLVSGGTLLAASLIAGGLWDVAGPRGTFLAGGAFALAALAGLLLVRRVLRDGSRPAAS